MEKKKRVVAQLDQTTIDLLIANYEVRQDSSGRLFGISEFITRCVHRFGKGGSP